MGKASELSKALEEQPLTPQEHEQREGPRPALRLSDELINEALGPAVSIGEALTQANNSARTQPVVLRDPETEQTAVVLSADEYLDLVTSRVKDRQLYQTFPDRRIGPSAETLADLGVEQVDPRATWWPVEGYDPAG